ncbi:hypothetical protein EZV62_008908 [Acer yangbiense]|uniref:Uncharacterized protein n=1 Tax=Acer yangbiense TaxID=1000413 RepID=A0A5C7IEE2_9ROSI|nr:hypothetical protein EZV62_008908 [Acer yangbiense]
MVGNSSTLGKATSRSSHTGICSQSVTLPETPLTTPPSTNTLRPRYRFSSLVSTCKNLNLELDVVQVEGVGSESTKSSSSSSSRYATITGDGAVCWQKEIEIQRRKKEVLEKNVQFVLSLKKLKTLETKEEIIERNIRFVRQFQKKPQVLDLRFE